MSKIVEGSYPPEHPQAGPSSKAGAPTPVGKVRPMLTVVPGQSEGREERPAGAAGSSSLIDEIVREGARRMLAVALEAEVAAYIDAHADQVDADGHRLVVRNGHHEPREVTTAAGAGPVRAARVNDKRVDEATGGRRRFSSAILPPGHARARRWPRCYRCCTSTAYPAVTSCRRWDSSSARRRGCRRR